MASSALPAFNKTLQLVLLAHGRRLKAFLLLSLHGQGTIELCLNASQSFVCSAQSNNKTAHIHRQTLLALYHLQHVFVPAGTVLATYHKHHVDHCNPAA